jgi:hypothetical protein
MSDTQTQKPKLVLVQASLAPSSGAAMPQASAGILRERQRAYSKVLKSSSRVQSYDPVELVSFSHQSMSPQQQILEGLNQNLNTLKDLQGRLRFMISEVEGLVMESQSSRL